MLLNSVNKLCMPYNYRGACVGHTNHTLADVNSEKPCHGERVNKWVNMHCHGPQRPKHVVHAACNLALGTRSRVWLLQQIWRRSSHKHWIN